MRINFTIYATFNLAECVRLKILISLSSQSSTREKNAVVTFGPLLIFPIQQNQKLKKDLREKKKEGPTQIAKACSLGGSFMIWETNIEVPELTEAARI